ncbi:MAG: hypothetical protein AB1656_19655 [Candidatus Omnitrophota bacterium]
MNSKTPKQEVILNGILQEEVAKYFHICFYLDDEGPDLENADHYIFIPKPVCRILDDYSVAILDWYVKKKKLMKFIRGRHSYLSKKMRGESAIKWRKPIGVIRR